MSFPAESKVVRTTKSRLLPSANRLASNLTRENCWICRQPQHDFGRTPNRMHDLFLNSSWDQAEPLGDALETSSAQILQGAGEVL
jgi:hypothetical protein